MPCIVLSEYCPEWTQIFCRDQILLMQAFDPPPIAVEPIGSTAVPGLTANPGIELPRVRSNVCGANESMGGSARVNMRGKRLQACNAIRDPLITTLRFAA